MKTALLGLGLTVVSALTDSVRDSIRENFGEDRFVTIGESQLSNSVLEILLDSDQFGFKNGEHHLRLSQPIVEALTLAGIEFEDHTEEFLAEVESNLQSNDFVCSEGAVACAAKAADDFYNSYHTRDTYHERLENLAAANSDIATVETLGLSYEGKEQKIIKIGDDGEKPLIFYFCAIHAREWLTPPFCMHLAESLLDTSNEKAQNLLKAYSFAITPVANPDGYDYTHEVDNFWRKTRKPTGFRNCIGTDPNRNWGFEWGGVGASTNACSDTYRGSEPFDQECVANIKTFVDANQDRLIHINDVHSYGEYYLNPWGWTEDFPPEEDFAKMEVTNQALYDAIRATSGQRFKVGPASTTIYPASGGSMDYFYGSLGIVYAGVYEARDGGRTGFAGFQPPTSNIKESNEELFAGLYALADKVYEIELCSDLENTNIYREEGAEEESCENLLNYCSRSEVVRQRCAASCRSCFLEEIVPEARPAAFILPNAGTPADEQDSSASSNGSGAGLAVGVILVIAGILVGLFVARNMSKEEKTVEQPNESKLSHYNV